MKYIILLLVMASCKVSPCSKNKKESKPLHEYRLEVHFENGRVDTLTFKSTYEDPHEAVGLRINEETAYLHVYRAPAYGAAIAYKVQSFKILDNEDQAFY